VKAIEINFKTKKSLSMEPIIKLIKMTPNAHF
jgi:hypothetical protein